MKQTRIIIALLAAFSWATASIAQDGRLARTRVAQGEIEGQAHDGYALYAAIPYAEAPVGNLRWKAPVPKKAWEGVYDAKTFAPQPPQPGDAPSSEDCLYLSVQTPARSADEKLPVYVYIHGGGFSGGHYAGTLDGFVRNGIIYVSIEYRLGVLGFMAHPELTKESPDGISGNYGLLDQICALRWIHDNIAAFGGDPERVTIAGESAGAISVSILCASPLCKGLFQRAVSESGGSFWPVAQKPGSRLALCTVPAAEERGLAFQKKMGAKNLKQLRKMSAQELTKDTRMEDFWPVADGRVIVGDAYERYLAGEFNDVDVLIGTNSDEGWMFSSQPSVEEYRGYMQSEFGDFTARALELYPAEKDEDTRFAMADIFRDVAFAWPTYAWANLQSAKGKGRVFVYHFDQNSDAFGKTPRGANHVAEMPFIYGWGHERMTHTEKHMANIMSRYWMNFAKTGTPNAVGLPYWSTYEEGKPTVMIMREGFHLDNLPNRQQMNLLEDFFRTKR